MAEQTMVERAASAALVAMYPEGAAQSVAENGRVIVSPQMFEHARAVACAVIEAMREPTEEMLAPRFMFTVGYGDEAFISDEDARYNWQAMIDAALSEPPAFPETNEVVRVTGRPPDYVYRGPIGRFPED